MDEISLRSKVYYYSREKLFHLMLQTCEEGVNRFHENVCFNFYRAIALLLCNRFHESVSKLQSLQLEDDYRLASLLALVHIYEVGELRDSQAFPHLYSQIEECKLVANSVDLMESAYISYLFENYRTAHEYIEKSVKTSPLLFNLSLKGWIELRLYETDFKISYKPRDWFEKSLEKDASLDAILGLSECFCVVEKYDEALSLLNKASVQYPDNYIPLAQKLKVYFASHEWEQFSEVYNQLHSRNKQYPEVISLNIVKLICNDANYKEAASCIEVLINYIEKFEPKNSNFTFDCAKLFSRICDKDSNVLSKSYKLAEITLQIFPNKHEYLSELGYQCFLQGRYQEAIRYYKLAIKINESSVSSLIEMTLCELHLNGLTKQLISQVEFLLEIQESDSPPLLQYLASKITDNADESRKLLKRAMEKQLKKIDHCFYSARYCSLLNPDFLLMLVNEMSNIIQETMKDDQKFISDPDLYFIIDITKVVVKACPGLFTSTFLLAKLNYMVGNLSESQKLLNRIINDLERTSSNTYLLLAQTQIKQGLHDTALHNLELGLSNDFTIRDNVLYHFLMGIVLKQHEKYDEAITSLKTALNLCNLNEKASSVNLPSYLRKISVYKELVQIYLKTGQQKKVAELLQEATEEFKGTSDESAILLMSADFALTTGEVKTAIGILEKIEPHDPCYVQAKIKLASIMLEKRRDRCGYLNCYKEVVKSNKSAEGYVLLGDAYLNILETEEAIESYEKALKMSPSDLNLMLKMGRTLVLTHRYKKACEFYESAIKTTNSNQLKIELAKLYILIKQLDQAKEFLESEIKSEENKDVNDLVSYKYNTTLLKFLADVHIQKNDIDSALKTLKRAAENQRKVRRIFTIERTDVPEEEIDLSIDLNLDIADIYLSQCEYLQAVKFQKEALLLKQNNPRVLALLAKSYVQINEMEKCQEMCNALLKVDPENETALILQADIAFYNVDFEGAFVNFSNFLNKDQTNWKALSRLIESSKRLGNIEQAYSYIELAEQATDVPEKSTGLFYCTGLYYWYSGNPNAALRNFNNARQDQEWSKNALLNMIEICLTPDDGNGVGDNINIDDLEYKDSRSMALKTAEKLLNELKQQTAREPEYKVKCRLLTNLHLLAYKDKDKIERALEDLVSMASEESLKEHVGVIFGLATGYTLLKQSQRAKTQLKRLFKHNWTYEEAEYLERCWLLHADYHMQSSKYDLASDLLKKVLKYNKSCVKAYEGLGYVSEKEQSYKEAASYYGYAWKLAGKTNPSVGYKLAFCFMKCKKYADAIETSHDVLALYPDYPRIKKDILDKSLNNLRT